MVDFPPATRESLKPTAQPQPSSVPCGGADRMDVDDDESSSRKMNRLLEAALESTPLSKRHNSTDDPDYTDDSSGMILGNN